MRLVIVDDEPGMRELIRMAVAGFGWHVETGPSAKALARSISRADLVVLDVHLDDENGLDTLRAYRRSDGTAPVIVLTGDDSAKLRRAAQRAGATAITLKPFDMIDFLDRLEELASMRHDPVRQIIDLTDAAPVARPWYAS